MYVANVFPF